MQNPTTFQVYNASAGSGKTFTLVKEYLKILLKSDNPFIYQKILAITFTNKAASEMKERILISLLDFSKGETSSQLLAIIAEEIGMEESLIKLKAERRLHHILQNYSSFHVKTIDSFNSKLIKSFAFDLGLTMDFEVELDPKSLIEEAVDVIISNIGIDKELTKVLVNFAKLKTIEDRSWDVSRELKEISLLLLKENDANAIKKLRDKSIVDFNSLEIKIKKSQKESALLLSELGQKGINLINQSCIAHKDFYYSQFPKFLQNLINNLSSISFSKEKGLGKSIENQLFYTKGKPDVVKQHIDQMVDALIGIYHQAEIVFQKYYLKKLLMSNLTPLAIINLISKALEEIKLDKNVRLIGEFNQIISRHLRDQPAAFIYEKIGERFNHYFIDEMQDTSVLQWENMIPLIDNALSEENSSLLLVGDAKQAIYRWRGGKAEQFIELSGDGTSKQHNPFQVGKSLENLVTNYRSYTEIVNFNNLFFSHISQYFNNEKYRKLYLLGNKQEYFYKKGGYVQLDFMDACSNMEERNKVFPERVYQIISNLGDDFDKSEICVLVRKKSQGVAIANYLTDKGIQIVSSETLLVQNNLKVNFIIQLMKLIREEKDGNAKLNVLYFLYHNLNIEIGKDEFIKEMIHVNGGEFYERLEAYQVNFDGQMFKQLPIYEGVEMLIRSFKLNNDADAHLQFFMDFVLEFTLRKTPNNMEFLEYWEQKKEQLSVIASSTKGAVQIMTIHKSKGLEFQVVIFPYDLDIYYQKNPKFWLKDLDEESYDGFKNILINSSVAVENIGDLGKQIYAKQQSELELDNFNLLYVALTRAKEQLYIVSEHKTIKGKPTSFAHFFIDFLIKTDQWIEGKLRYEFGSLRRLSEKVKNKLDVEIQHELISTSWREHQFNIVTNATGQLDSNRGDAIQFGNMIHEIMARVITHEDVERSIVRAVNKGLIEKGQGSDVERIIFEIVNHQDLALYYQSDKTIFTEREIFTTDKKILIPDRLIFENEKYVTVIDYKTGSPEKRHHGQVEEYARTLEEMGFTILKKILVYIDHQIKVVHV